ncbi:hypothetical protein PFNF54_02858 [Plasmodium falciparum NF54]|uniref:Uncharacterized protein n=1 Tax=Plasmodium falciparum (isolate NF54) TaxID=5843 RepID=W7JTQ8_PLAFO|nr:hypothetical protein PFNF54_02858 [Plasmodium falciparum NF54]
MDNNNIVYIEKKTKEKKKEEKEKNKEFDSFHMKNIFLLVIHFLFYIILVHIYYTYNNENLLQCFNNSFSYILKSPYLNIYDVEIIQNNLSNISQMCNHDKLNYSKYIDTDYFKYSFLFYNQHVNTYIDSIEYGSTYEKFIALLIYIYYILLILNIFKELSKVSKIFRIPINIISNTLKHNKVLFISLSAFVVVPFVKYITSLQNYSDYIKSFDLFEKNNIYKNEYPYYFLFSLIYNFFFIPMIIVISTASTFLLVNKNDLLLNCKLRNMPLWLKIKEYLFFFQVNKKLNKQKMFISDEKNIKNMSILKFSNISCFGLFFIFLILKINFDQSSYDHINKKYNLLLKEYFLTDTNMEKSYDTFTYSADYYNFLNSIVIKNIMRNKKDLQNKNLFDINLNLNDYNISIYDDFFNHFPYDVFLKFSGNNQISDEITIANPLLAHESNTDSTKLENYKSIIEDNKGRIKYYDAYSILYNFEYSLSLLIRTSFKVQHYGVFKKDKEIFVHEIYEDNYNNMYNYKYILLIIMFIITIIYLILTIFMVYYIRSKIYISFFSFFFLNFFFFFLFHFMSFTPVSYFYDYINDIKENQISEIFNNMNKQDNFRSLLFDLLKIKWYKFYANLFSYIIILTSLLNFFFLFFINHISFLIKHKKKFLLVSIPIWISVFFMSLIGSYFPCNIQKNIFKWILLFYQIQTNQNSFPYEVLNKFIFVFFLFYLTSIFLFIYVKKKPNIIKLKRRNYQNDKDPKQVPFNNTNICENYDILLYFKALLYSLDKTFEKVQLLKEKNKFSQMLNLQINMYNMYEQQKMMLQYGNINAQGNYMNGQTNNENNYMNGQTNNFMNDQTNNYMNSQVHTEIPYRPNENAQTSSQIMNGKHNYDHTMVGNIQDGKGINTHAKHKLYEIKKNDDHDIIDEDTSNNEDLERQNKNKDDEVDMIEKIENMSLFFTNILNEKYDFNFLKDENIKNNKKKTLVQWIISGLYDKDNYKRNEEDKEKRQKNTKQLKRMIENLNEDLYYIDKIKISFTYLLFLKIKKYILIQKFNNLKEKKGELKTTYQNKILYKSHLSKLQQNLTKQMYQLEKNVLITNNLRDGLIHIIEDEAFYKKDEQNSSEEKKEQIINEEAQSNKGRIFEK